MQTVKKTSFWAKFTNVGASITLVVAGILGIMQGQTLEGAALVVQGVRNMVTRNHTEKEIKKLKIATHTDLINGNKPLTQ